MTFASTQRCAPAACNDGENGPEHTARLDAAARQGVQDVPNGARRHEAAVRRLPRRNARRDRSDRGWYNHIRRTIVDIYFHAVFVARTRIAHEDHVPPAFFQNPHADFFLPV